MTRAGRVAPLGPGHRAAWEALVAADPGTGFMQSWAWSAFKELEGYRVIRLGVFTGETLTGGALAYVFPSPAEAALAVVPDGPVLDWEAPGAGATFRRLAAAVRGNPAGRRVAVVRVEPRLLAAPACLRALPRGPADLVPDETALVALGPEARMLAAMRPKGRYNARLAARRGVEVVTSLDPADVHALYSVLAETARYQDFLLEPKSFFVNLAAALMPGMARIALARYQGVTLAAALVLRHGATATYLYGGRLPLHPELMASEALHWHVMREAARDGYRHYDLYGYVGPDRPDHPYHGFSRFKDKLGGHPVRRIGSRDVVFYDRLAAAALRVLRAAPARAAAEGA